MRKGKSQKVVVIALATLLSLSVFSLSGCGTKAPSTTPTSSAPAASTAAEASTPAAPKLSGEITVASWNDAADAMIAVGNQFMKENAGTTITIQKVDSNYTKLYAELAAGSEVPDVVQTQNRDFASFYTKYPKAWLEVTDLVKPEEQNFDSVVLPMVIQDGKYFAVPWDVGPCALFYRTDVFKSAGIDPSKFTTYDDLIAAGKTISTSSGGKQKILGLDYSGSSSQDVVNLFFNQAGGKWYDSNGKVQLNTPEMLSAISLTKKFLDAGTSMNLANEWNDRITAIENNQLVALPYAVWYSGTLRGSVKDQSGKWGIVPLPAITAGGGTQANEGGSILAISSATKNADLAKAFVKYGLMTNEGNVLNLSGGGLFTSYKPTYQDPAYKTIDPYFGLSIGATFSALSDKIPTITYGAYQTNVNTAYSTAIGNILVKNMDPAKALDEASATAQKAIDNQK